MPRPLKYNYDIQIIESGINKKKTLKEIALQNKWDYSAMRTWLYINYDRVTVTKFVKK